MAASNWFHNWNSPFFENHNAPMNPPGPLTDNRNGFGRAFDNFNSTNVDYYDPFKSKSSPNVPKLLPIFMSLNLAAITVPQKQQRKEREPIEMTGPFKTWYQWNVLDFAYPSEGERDTAIFSQEFIPMHNLPLGLETYKDRLFLTMPKWKPGVPASLAVLPKVPKEKSPKLVPYPNWSWHNTESCDGITSVFRLQADECGRLWVLDSGLIEVTIKPKQICPPQLLVFDLKTDELLLRYTFPKEFIKQDSLYSNIMVDVRDGDCDDVYAYMADVWRYGIVVFSLEEMKGWRITDHLFYPDPLAARYKLHDLEFEWTDGIFGMSLSPDNKKDDDRLLYFNPMSSFRQFYVKTSFLRNETASMTEKRAFKVLGQSRGPSGHASATGMDRNGVLFYNLVTRDSIGCWDSRKPYKRSNLGLVAKSSRTLVFPNDLRIDKEKRQSLWIITNRLPYYIYKALNTSMVNFRVMSAFTDESIEGTVCDPERKYHDSFIDFIEQENDCY